MKRSSGFYDVIYQGVTTTESIAFPHDFTSGFQCQRKRLLFVVQLGNQTTQSANKAGRSLNAGSNTAFGGNAHEWAWVVPSPWIFTM